MKGGTKEPKSAVTAVAHDVTIPQPAGDARGGAPRRIAAAHRASDELSYAEREPIDTTGANGVDRREAPHASGVNRRRLCLKSTSL
jgi:hypothetical protein